MSTPNSKTPLFAMAATQPDTDNFEEDEEDNTTQTTTPDSAAPKQPFSLFGSSFFSSSSGGSNSAATMKAGVVEGEEDEDEPESSPTPSAPSSAAGPSSTSESSASTGKSGAVEGPSHTQSAATAQQKRRYTKSELKVVEMNRAIRKAPVKKMKEGFVQLRSELAPIQNLLTSSVRAANEAHAQSAGIDQQLALLGDRLTTLKPIFA